MLLESLYRLTDLEVRFPLNLNVLDASRTPGVMSLKEALAAWLGFQIEVLVRRSQVRIGKIDERLELLDGFLIAFLNLDRVIEIIRTEDEPKPVMIAEFALSDRQAEAILNMRLRSACAGSRKWRSAEGARRARQGARGAREADRGQGPAATPNEEGPAGAEGEVRRRAAHSARGGRRRRARSTGRR